MHIPHTLLLSFSQKLQFGPKLNLSSQETLTATQFKTKFVLFFIFFMKFNECFPFHAVLKVLVSSLHGK